MRKRLVLALLVMGLSGLIAEILLLRELLITFYGNELSIGVILANWLILEAIGSFFLGKKMARLPNPLNGFVGIQLIFSISLPIAIYLTRILKGSIIGISPGEGLGLLAITLSSFLILALVSISHGALFTIGCKAYSLYYKREDATSIGKVYIYETLGAIMGGICFTYFLIPYLHSFQIALSLSLLNIIICLCLLGNPWISNLSTKILFSFSIVPILLILSMIFTGGADRIHWLSINTQWRGQEVLHYQNSIYGNVAVTEREEQYTIYSDGTPIITTPVPDITFVEEFVHLPMLHHSKPKEILVISGGAGGIINEILKHPIERVDYAELDPLVLELARKFPTPLTEAELNNERVNIEHIDGRIFVKRTSHKYDLIFISSSDPSDLQVNRLFTREFFSLVKDRLKEEGIFVVNLPGSLTYLNEELRNLNGCIINTIGEIFPHLKIIPGDFNLFLASTSPKVTQISQSMLGSRLKERGIKTSLITSSHIEYRLNPKWLDWFSRSLKGATDKINKDFQPLGLFYSISHWNAIFSPYMRVVFKWFGEINLLRVFLPISIFTLIFLLICTKIRGLSVMSIPFSICTTGFAGMVLNLALIFAFQSLYGYVFYWIGMLVTSFMAGVAVGGIVMTSLLTRIKRDIASFVKVEISIVLFSCILPLIFIGFNPYLERPIMLFLFKIVFLILMFLSGVIVGVEFPLANKIYLGVSRNISGTAGLLYGADLLGGWIGGIVGGVVLLPVLGLFGTCLVIVMIKASSLIILTASKFMVER